MADLINILNHFVQEQPEAVAVRHTNDELTYKQLDEESSKHIYYKIVKSQ